MTGLLSLVVGRKIQNQKWLIINFLLEGKYLVIYDNQPKKFESVSHALKTKKFGRKSSYKFPKSNTLLYVTGSGERSWYELEKTTMIF